MDRSATPPLVMEAPSTSIFGRREHLRANALGRVTPPQPRKMKKDAAEEDESNSLNANEILLQLNDDPYCSGNSSSAESSENGESLSTNDIVYPRLEEGDAKRQIELIFRTPACWRSESDQTHLLYLLQRFPCLASQNFDWDYNLFWQHGNEWSSPLCFLLASGANLETIKAAYHLFPAAISRPQGVNRDLPLHFACRFGVSEDVLVFLAQKFPYAVMVSNSSGMLPIHCALGKKDIFPYGQFTHATLETVKILIELYPQCLMKEEQQCFYTPLQIAFSHGYSCEVIDYLIRMMPSKIDSFNIKAGCYHNKRFALEFGLSESTLASKLLSRLERFCCEPTDWKKEGLIRLLMGLQQNTSVTHFKATNLTASLLLDEDVMNAFCRVFRVNKSLKSVGLSLKLIEENVDASPFFECLDRALQGNKAMHCLELERFPVSCVGLNRYLSSGNAPSTLKMTAFTLFQGSERGLQWTRPVVGNRIEKVIMSGFSFLPAFTTADCEHFSALLHGIAYLPRLKELTLNLPQMNQMNITGPLVHLLQSESLERLTVRGPVARIEPACETMQFNTTLRYFNFPALADTTTKRAALAGVLENHNARIEFIQMPKRKRSDEDRESKKIQYLTRLNSFGRSCVRDSDATRSGLVSLLDDFATQSQELKAEEKLSVVFGLLREAPSLWCNAFYETDVAQHPRKRQRILH